MVKELPARERIIPLKGSFGGGKDSISAWGVYDSYQNSFSGFLFFTICLLLVICLVMRPRDKVKSFFVIEVYPVNRDTTNFPVLDSLREGGCNKV